MDATQREPYVRKSKKGRDGDGPVGKLSCIGVELSAIEKQLHDKKTLDQAVKGLTDKRVMMLTWKSDLALETFYFISMEYFCRTNKGTFIPAELGIVKYSLYCGVMDQFHTFINPREIPLGYAYAASQHAQETHKLPLPPDALGVTNFDEIADQLISFLGSDIEKPLLLFTDVDGMPAVENMLQNIFANRASKLGMLNVCPLGQLFFKLKHASMRYDNCNSSTIPSVLMAQQILAVDRFGHAFGISCDYHEMDSNGCYCPLSRAIRWSYTISSFCCPHLGFELIPGKHIPDKSQTKIEERLQQRVAAVLAISSTGAVSLSPDNTETASSSLAQKEQGQSNAIGPADEWPSLTAIVKPQLRRRK